MKVTLTLFTILLLACLSTSLAQENLKPGKLTLKNGQGLEGFVDYKNWNSKTVEFTLKPDQQLTKYSPKDVARVEVEGEVYVGADVRTEISLAPGSSAIYEKSFDDRLEFSTEKAFLQVLVEGSKGLYFLKNSVGKENFYIEGDNEFILLEYKRYFKLVSGRKVIGENRVFRGQLATYMRSCRNIEKFLVQAEYTEYSLTSLFKQYFACILENEFYTKPKKKVRGEFGVKVGVSNTSIGFEGSAFDYLVNTEFPGSQNFAAGLFYEIILPAKEERFSFYNELAYSAYETQGTDIDDSRTVITVQNDMELALSYLKLNNMLRLKYPIGKAFWYINGGISNGFVISQKNFRRRTANSFGVISQEDSTAIEGLRTYEQGLLIGTGVMFNRYSIAYRFERANGIDNIGNFSSSTSRSFLFMGYRF